MDRPNTVHCADLRHVLVDQSAVLQLGKRVRVLFHRARLLRRYVRTVDQSAPTM